MDYETSIILSREQIRLLSKFFRNMFAVKTVVFPVLKILNKMENKFADNLYFSVEEDRLFERNVMAELIDEGDNEHYHIRIKESVYNKAVDGDRASICFICHELCHFFLIYVCGIGPKKYYDVDGLAFSKSIGGMIKPVYKSMEWQAKALCGEVMIPYQKCKNYTLKQIIYITKSSTEQAKYYLEKVKNK